MYLFLYDLQMATRTEYQEEYCGMKGSKSGGGGSGGQGGPVIYPDCRASYEQQPVGGRVQARFKEQMKQRLMSQTRTATATSTGTKTGYIWLTFESPPNTHSLLVA